MPPAPAITVTVNGEPVQVAAGTRLAELLANLGEPTDAGLVERNRRYVHKQELAQIVLEDGDLIEVILPAFGG